MAVGPETPKSTPDVPKLNQMTRRMAFVTKMLRGSEQSIVDGTGEWSNATVGQILSLPSIALRLGGPGIYRFKVFDEGGPDVVEWTSRLGAELQDHGPSAPSPDVSGAPPPTGSRHLGNGVWWDPETKILTLRSGKLRQWDIGQPLPTDDGLPMQVNAGASTSIAAGGGSDFVADLLRREREEKREEEMRRAITEQNQRFEKMLESLARPHGPSPEMVAMQARLEAAEKRSEELRQQAESKQREDALRAEMRVQAERSEALIRELKESTHRGPDPMTTLLGNLLQTMQATAANQASSVKDAVESITSRLASAMVTPERMLEIIRAAKDSAGSSEMMRSGLDMFQRLVGMTQDTMKMQADMNRDDTPWWAGMVAETGGKLAQGLQAMANRPQVVAPPVPVRRVAPPPPPRLPPPPPPEPVTPDEKRAAVAAEIDRKVSPNGKSKKNKITVVEAPAAVVPAPAPVAQGKSPLEGATPDAVRAVVKEFDDSTVFGGLMEGVGVVRDGVARGAQPDQVAEQVLRARVFFRTSGEFPPAAELMQHEQYEVLIERLLPQAPIEYQQAVLDAISARLDAEESPGQAA